jgi:peroxiredoxin
MTNLELQAIADQVAEMRAEADAILTVCPGERRPCPGCECKARQLRENADRLEARGAQVAA